MPNPNPDFSTPEVPRLEQAILYDASKCTACKGCQVSCKQWNQNPSPLYDADYDFPGSLESPLENDADTFLHMSFDEYEGGHLGVKWAFGRVACHHCTDAGCVRACPTGACHHVEGGFVNIDPDRCIGCHYCQTGCPFGIPKHSDRLKIERKCWMCLDRVDQGKKPACVSSCTSHALEFGSRDKMLEIAHERLEYLKAGNFPDAEIYGEHELDGLHVIDILPYGIESVDLPRDPKVPIISRASHILKPAAAIGAAATFVALTAARKNGKSYYRDPNALVYDEELGEQVLVGKVNQVGFEDYPKAGEGEIINKPKEEIIASELAKEKHHD